MRLEGFMDWVNLPTGENRGDCPTPQISSGLTEEGEQDMSSLAVRFAARMLK